MHADPLVRPVVWIPEDTPDDAREALGAIAELHTFRERPPDGERLGRADILIAGSHPRRALDIAGHLEGLRVIQVSSAGVDSIVGHVPAGVMLCDASGVHDVPVAEWIVMAILASQRHLLAYRDAQRDGTWLRDGAIGDDLDGATVAIVGAGSIGRAVEARLAPFGPRFVRVGRRPREGARTLDDLAAILPDADVAIVLLPLTDATRRAIGSELIARMRPGALLVVASRGGVVDMEALTEAVVEGRIRVAMDVTDPEPLPEGHPLWTAPGVLITPHVGSHVRNNDGRAWRFAVEQVARFARGEPLVNVVTDGY